MFGGGPRGADATALELEYYKALADAEKEDDEVRRKRKRGAEEDLDDYMRELEQRYPVKVQ